MEFIMTISVDERMPLTLQQAQTSKDSLKLADMQKTFSIISEVPSTDIVSTNDNQTYTTQMNEILDTLKALQVAKKSLSDAQSITKDIKSNYKTEKNDAWAPIDDTMLKQRYEAVQQIKNIFNNATFNHKNVFTIDYSKNGVKLDLERKDINSLNLRDEHSINIFSDNINRLSQQIEDNIQKLQDKVDNMNKGRWLSMENLRNVKLQQKEVNAGLQANTTPSLASALAQVAQQKNVQQEATKNSPTIATQEPMQDNDNKENTKLSLDDNKATESNVDSKGNEAQNEINSKDTEATNKENIPKTDMQNTTNNKDSKTDEAKETSTNQTQQKSIEEANKETSIDNSDHSTNKQEDNANVNDNKIKDSKETLANANSNVNQTTNENSKAKEADSKLDSKIDSVAGTDSKADSKENTTQESTQATTQTNINNDLENDTKVNAAGQNSTQVSESSNNEKQNDTQNKVASTETNANSTSDKENGGKEQVIDLFV